MKALRIFRIILAVIFLAASVICLVLAGRAGDFTESMQKTQIVLSTISVTAGATIFWIFISFLGGRFYCSTVCPVGTLSDLIMHISRRIRPKPFRYQSRSRLLVHILWIYLLCVLLGIVIIPFCIEPWNIMRNVASTVNPEAVAATWMNIGFSASAGMICGLIALIAIIILAVRSGRRFCTDFCPIGGGLGYLSNYSIYHIEIDRDKCSSCGLCEDICRSSCIKTVSRYIDNTRCVRCLDCIVKCPDKAINLQKNRNRPATPLMNRVKRASKT